MQSLPLFLVPTASLVEINLIFVVSSGKLMLIVLGYFLNVGNFTSLIKSNEVTHIPYLFLYCIFDDESFPPSSSKPLHIVKSTSILQIEVSNSISKNASPAFSLLGDKTTYSFSIYPVLNLLVLINNSLFII